MSSDSWDSFGSKTKASDETPSEHLDLLCHELYTLELDLPNKLDRIQQLQNEIALAFPEVEGEQSKTTSRFQVSCARGERWSWDKPMLEEIFGEGDLPEYVTRSLSVDKRKFKKLPNTDQNNLKPALTRKLDRAKIKVVQNV